MKFIAYFDYLGFKQFIQNNDLDYQKKIMGNNFRDMESALSQGKLIEASHGVISDLSTHRVHCINFSDTIVFFTNDDSFESLTEILNVAYEFNWRATTFFFPARGALVRGEIEYVDFKNENNAGGVYNVNSVFGKGLVTAHQKAEAQHWSGTVLDESFVTAIINMGHNPATFLSSYAKEYIVPYKNITGNEEEYVLNLIKGEMNPVAFDNVTRNVEENFARHKKDVGHRDVQEKIQNTITFLETYKSKTAFSDGDYKILIEHLEKSELNEFYVFIIKRALYVKKHTESDDKIIPALLKILKDKVGTTSLDMKTESEIVVLIEELFNLLIQIDIKEVHNVDI